MADNRQSKFITLLLETLLDEYKDIGWRTFIPYLMIICIMVAVIVAVYMPSPTTIQAQIVPILAALLTAQGIILAMCISSGQQIFNTISVAGFSGFLRREGILSDYLVCISIMEFMGIFSIVVILATAGFYLFKVPDILLRVFTGISVFCFLYSIRWVAGGSVMVRDLIYYRSVYDDCSPDRKKSSVVPLHNQEKS